MANEKTKGAEASRAIVQIPCYPCDRVLFPGSQLSPDDEREDTTFFQDFKIAEPFGFNAVKDTFKRAFSSWKNSIKYLTELAVVTNHLGWNHYGSDEKLSKFYFEAYETVCAHVYQSDDEGNNASPFKDSEVVFFHSVLD